MLIGTVILAAERGLTRPTSVLHNASSNTIYSRMFNLQIGTISQFPVTAKLWLLLAAC